MSKHRKKVLFIRSNPVAPDPRVEKESRALIKDGYQVDVLCWAREKGFPVFEKKTGISIFRQYILAAYGSGLSNFPALLCWQVKEFFWLLKNGKKYEVLHACDFDTVLPALVYRLIARKKLVYDIFDFYADHLRRTPQFIKKLIRKIDLAVINQADGVILVDKSRLQQIAGSKPRKLIYVYNTPEDKIEIVENLQNDSSEKLRIIYVGLLQKERGLFTLLNCLEKHPEWELDLAGFGGDEIEIKARAEQLTNVYFWGRVDYDKALELGAAADVFYALYDPEIPNHKYASPNKVFEAMMLGKPVIVAENTNVDKIIREWKCGIVVDFFDEKQIENALQKFADKIDLCVEKGKNSRWAYEQCYNWGVMERELVGLYNGFENVV